MTKTKLQKNIHTNTNAMTDKWIIKQKQQQSTIIIHIFRVANMRKFEKIPQKEYKKKIIKKYKNYKYIYIIKCIINQIIILLKLSQNLLSY